MARLLRVQFPGAIYHVTLRGNNRRTLFRDDKDRARFLARLSEYAEELRIRLYIFCIMSNHVHLLIETPEANLSAFMQKLQTAYSVYFNLRHGESGHVMDGRYKAKLVEGDDYLLKLSRYIHLNPVFIGKLRTFELRERIKVLRGYRWSSYRSYIGEDRALEYVEYGPMLGFMRGSQAKKRRAYRKFVESGLAESDDEMRRVMKESRLSMGGEAFREKIRDLHHDLVSKHRRTEDVALRKIGSRLPVDRILDAVCAVLGVHRGEIKRRRRDSWLRPLTARMLSKYGGLTQRGIADVMGIGTGASVSDQMRRLEDERLWNKELDVLVKRAESQLVTLIAESGEDTAHESVKR